MGDKFVRIINSSEITNIVKDMCIEANIYLGNDVKNAIRAYEKEEESILGKNILNILMKNCEIAEEKQIPICQDTGMAVFFVSIGQDVHIEGMNITDAINEGVRQGYLEGYLRKSVVYPIDRINTKDNTPAIIHYDIVEGDSITIEFAPKGFGSENMSKLKMLKPSDGVNGIKEFIIETVKEAGPNPCPPIVVGVGIGGTVEKCAQIAKKSLLRELGNHNEDETIKQLEIDILKDINNLGIGPQGLGGNTTALAVNIEAFPTHIAGLPVVVNINCHASRHKKVKI
jgi:fumarate hydratase subunit alpha